MAKSNKILVAEDDKFLSKILVSKLKKSGFGVELAENGEEALEKMKEDKPDLILLDIIMPEKNGFEVLEDMRKNKNLKNVPVIILSNLGQQSDIEKGKKLGVVDYWVKANFSLNEVIQKVKENIK